MSKVSARNSTSAILYSSTLGAAITDETATTITLSESSNFLEKDVIKIGNENIRIGSVSNSILKNCQRGYSGTTASTHSNGAAVNGVFLGDWEPCSGYSSISVAGKTDQNSALYAQFSNDKINIDDDQLLSPDTTSTLGNHVVTPMRRFFRVKCVANGTTLGHLRLQTIYDGDQRLNMKQINDTKTIYDSAQLTQSVLLGKDSSNDIQNILVDANGHLQVDVLSGGGGGTQYILGTNTYTGGTTIGTVTGVVRNDTLEALADDNEIAPLQVNASGALYTDGSNSTQPVSGTVTANAGSGTFTVDNAGTFVTQINGDALTALQKIDDPVIVDDSPFTPGTSSVNMAGAIFDDTTPDTINEGDAGALRMSTNRNLYTQIRDASGNERGATVDSSNQLAVADATGNSKLTDIETNTDSLTNTGGGTESGVLRVTIANDSTGVITVDDGGGSITIDGTITANAGTNLNTSALALESGGNLDTIAGDTTSIDGKLTEDANSNLQVVGRMEVGLGSGLTGYTHQRSTDEGALIQVPRCISQAFPDSVSNTGELPRSCTGSFVTAPAFGYVFNGSTWDRMRGSVSGLDIKNESSGSTHNLANNITIAQDATTSAVDVTDINKCHITYRDSAVLSVDSVVVELSTDNTTFFHSSDLSFAPEVVGAERKYIISGDLHGITHMRLKNSSSTYDNANAYATVIGTKFS